MKFNGFIIGSNGADLKLKKASQRDRLEISFSDFFEITFENDGHDTIKPIEWYLMATNHVSLKVDLIDTKDLVFSTIFVNLSTEYSSLFLPIVNNTKKLVVSLTKVDNVNADSKVFILSNGPDVIDCCEVCFI